MALTTKTDGGRMTSSVPEPIRIVATAFGQVTEVARFAGGAQVLIVSGRYGGHIGRVLLRSAHTGDYLVETSIAGRVSQGWYMDDELTEPGNES